MTIERLENTRDYFKHITQEAYRQFMDGKVTFLVIYSMATGLYHIAEWMWLHDHPKVKEEFGSEIDSAGALWHKVVEREVPGAGLIRDLTTLQNTPSLSFARTEAHRRVCTTRRIHSFIPPIMGRAATALADTAVRAM